jgi:hypothetical protein
MPYQTVYPTAVSNSCNITLYDYSSFLTVQTGGTAPTNMALSPYTMETWATWVNQTGTMNTQYFSPSDAAWQAWCYQRDYWSITNARTFTAVQPAVPPTPEQLVAQQARVAADRLVFEEAARVRAEKTVKARARAKSLLLEFLTPEQIEYMDRHGHIPVIGSRGRRYRIKTGGSASGNVSVVDDKGVEQGRFCVHPSQPHDGGSLPLEDSWLAQVLHLQADEDGVLKVANLVSGVNPLRELVPA